MAREKVLITVTTYPLPLQAIATSFKTVTIFQNYLKPF